MTAIVTNATEADVLAMGGDPSATVDIIYVQTFTTREASITKIVAKIQNDIIEVNGTSKRTPGDPFDPELGMMLSTARAYQNLSKRLAKRAKGLVDHYDTIRAQRPGQLARAAQWRANILRIASSDDAIQRAAVRAAREDEGTWVPRAQPGTRTGVSND